ncbi:MAG: DUF5320 family protein [Dehalococcoidales bacterium]|nr:DUF5320 family protein [Dehalococcoidales bacterium]
MNGVFGRGRGSGARGGMGFGFRGSSPPWPYVGRGRGGLPRCSYYTGTPAAAAAPAAAAPSAPAPGAAAMNREEELNYLRDQARAIRENLERINSRVKELESEK